MNLAAVKGFLDRYLGGAGRSLGSIVRILAVAAVSFLLIGTMFFPDRHRTYEENNYNRVRGIASDDVARITSGGRSDLHGFQPRVEDDSFRIAWVGGSSIQSVSETNYTFIPAEVARDLPTIDGREVTTDVYFLSGIRALDNYMAVLAAVEDEPDMIVVTINPAWVFNNTATRGWEELDPHAVQLLAADPQSASLFAPYLAPSDFVLGAASYASAPVRDRIRHSQAITDKLSGFTLLDRTPSDAEPPPPDELAQIRAMNIPVAFWRKYRLAPVPDQTLGERQAQILLESDLDANSINRAVLDNMARITAESGIPTYVYVAPVNHEYLADPVVDTAVADIEAEIASHADRWSAPNQRFVPTNLSRFVEPFGFADLIHIQEPEAVSGYLTPELCEFLATTGHICDE